MSGGLIVPELIVAPIGALRHALAWFAGFILIFFAPCSIDSACCQSKLVIVDGNDNSYYNPNTPIDAKTAGDFATYWASYAFDYSPKTQQASREAASNWNSSDALTRELNSTFWTSDRDTSPSKWDAYRLTGVEILDNSTAGINIDTQFSWNQLGLKEIPMNLHLVVKKSDSGYRMESVQMDFYDDSGCQALLVQSDVPSLYYWDGNAFRQGDCQKALEKIQPKSNNRQTYDYVYFAWCKKVLAGQEFSKNQLTHLPLSN